MESFLPPRSPIMFPTSQYREQRKSKGSLIELEEVKEDEERKHIFFSSTFLKSDISLFLFANIVL